MLPETVFEGLAFPECPRWRDGALYFSDMHDGVVWRLSPDGRQDRILELPSFPAGLGWLPDGTLQVVSMKDRRLLRMTSAGLATVADLSSVALHYTNDMVMDRRGRAYIGNFGFDLNGGESPRPTVLLSVTPDGVVSIAADDLWFPNGAVISPDGGTLLIAESFGAKISAFTIEDEGALSNRRVFAALDGLYPDGMCLDAEGSLWVACAGGHRVIRVTAGGEIAETISLPGRHAYACMLGGEDRRNLFLCTSQDHFPDRTVKLRSGRIEMVRVDTPGAGLP